MSFERIKNPYLQYDTLTDFRTGKVTEGALPFAEDAEASEVLLSFQEHIRSNEFPCLGAKASLSGNSFRFKFYQEIGSASSTFALARDLWNYAYEQPTFDTDFATFAASFKRPLDADEAEWERLMWKQLQSLHELDNQNADWDPTVSDDPASSEFSFSFAGTAFFAVGLHPGASRLARCFAWPTIVFNVHAQFERLRKKGLFDRLKDAIRSRDLKLQGSLNPNLSDFGSKSEARQYSGRAVGEEWKCPFHRLFKKKK